MTAPVLVPDASVLLKWVFESEDEEDRDRALEIREAWLAGTCEIVVPALWVFEVGNIVGRKQPRLAEGFVQVLIDYHFEEEPTSTFYAKALELMRKFKITFYDAVYHAVAIKRGGTLVTADANYCRKTAKAGHVMTLQNWTPSHLLGGKPDVIEQNDAER